MGILLQFDCQYLQRTVSKVCNIMGLNETALKQNFFPTLFGGGEVNADLQKPLGYSVKRGGLGIPNPKQSS